MKELVEIIKAYDKAKGEGVACALATVVHVEGSSYRRAGARMLVLADGYMMGAISGGCLEGDALRKALQVIHQQESRLVTYDTSDEEDHTIGIQLGCSGVIQVLFEPIETTNPLNPIELIREAISKRQELVLVTVFDLENRKSKQAGTIAWVSSEGEKRFHPDYSGFETMLSTELVVTFTSTTSRFISLSEAEHPLQFFLEYRVQPLRLVIVGAGNDAIPLQKMAHELGWEVRMVDGRSNLVQSSRFEAACQLLVSKPESVLEQLPIDRHTAFVMMTHNYNYDLAMLKILLPLHVLYIGMLGPKKKLERMLEELRLGGMVISDEMLEKVYGPTGLELGAETPEEIALSILSEILAVDRQKKGGYLKLKKEVIHDRELTRMKPI
jgi:xanthine/CO dehydrogenase XdhC/CoxF family maturation factor